MRVGLLIKMREHHALMLLNCFLKGFFFILQKTPEKFLVDTAHASTIKR